MKFTQFSLIGLLTLTFITITGCGSDSSKLGPDSASNIPYLKANHLNYSKSGTATTPAPEKNPANNLLTWSIDANTETDAIKLYDHINFMTDKLVADQNPRAWDELFLLEAFMKTSHRYTTTVNRITKTVLITKTATDSCAYKVISAHSDAVNGDFFAQGIINIDYSPIAQTIINSPDCTASKAAMDAYILDRKKAKGTK